MFPNLKTTKNFSKNYYFISACFFLAIFSLFAVLPALAANDCGTFTGTEGYTCQATGSRTGGTTGCVSGHCSGPATTQCCPAAEGSGGTGSGAGGVREGLGEAKAGLPQFKIEEKIGDIISTILGFVGILFLVLMIAGGLMWMTAGGSEDKLGKAKKLITSAVVGMIIVFSAYAITYFITETLLGR